MCSFEEKHDLVSFVAAHISNKQSGLKDSQIFEKKKTSKLKYENLAFFRIFQMFQKKNQKRKYDIVSQEVIVSNNNCFYIYSGQWITQLREKYGKYECEICCTS